MVTAEPSPRVGETLPAAVDWIVAAIVAITGLALTVGGSALTFVVDRGLLAESAEAGQLTVIVFERDLTRAQMLDFTLEVVFWTGTGLLLTGIGLVLFGIGYAVTRHRSRRRESDGEPPGTYRANAVLGAVSTVALSFLPFSPVIGGGIAGYLERDRSTSVGALAGFLASVPALVILAFVAVGMFAGLSAIQATGLGIVTAATMVFAALVIAAYGAGLGALGGFAGRRLADRQ
ncbi:MAG: DUF5518 domain-containing protein [Haloglomus sp.]